MSVFADYLQLQPHANIMEVKEAIEAQLNVPAAQQKLLYKGKPLTGMSLFATRCIICFLISHLLI